MRSLLFALLFTGIASADPLAAGDLRISPESRDLIYYYETGGKGYYLSRLSRPTVPPSPSGVTIGIGYDIGYNTAAQVRQDWAGVIPQAQVERLASVAGLKGASAKAALPRVRDIVIPWDAACTVYEKRTMPRFAKLTASTYPGIKDMPPHIQGVMLSTTFNRGSALSPYSRRKELVWSRDDIEVGRMVKLPSYQLSMRRLWPNIAGLQKRYAAHAGLMQRAVDAK